MSEYTPSAPTAAFVAAMVHAFPELAPVLDEHLADNGEVLPHLFMSDVARWMTSKVSAGRELVGEMLMWLEAQYTQGDPDVANVIDVSFVEMLPLPDEPGVEILAMLGPQLRAEARRQGHWPGLV